MKSKLEKLYFVVGVLDIILGAAEIAGARGNSVNMILGGGFIMIGFVNLFSSYKAVRREH